MPDQLPKENKLGLWTSTSLVVGNMIGAGVFLMPATLASYGSISLVGWVFATAGAFLLAKVFSNLSKLMPLADGGPYAYSREGLGDFAGFLVAWGYWISIWCTNAAIAVSLVSALSTFFPMLATNSLAAIATGLGTIWLLTWVNSLGIVASGVVQLVTTVLKIIPLLAVAIGGLFFLKISYFLPFNTSGTSSIAAITATTAFTFFAFTGLECATIPSGSVDNPEKTISRATMLGTGLAAIIYILSTVSVMGMIPADKLSHSLTPFADTAVLLWGSSARYWVSGGVAIAAFGALNGWILIQGQTPYAISKDKLFPAIFGKVNKKGVPIAGIVIGSILVSILMIMNYTKGLAEQFKFLLLLTTITVLISYLFSTVAYVLIKLQRKLTAASGHWPAAILLASLAFLFSLWAIGGSGQEPVYWGFILLLAGLPFYAMILWKKRM
ncbi:amino acid permease [Ferruginibacter paludis]|uniref:amino acid permease n=1 Tax=Ferruginibacter paludis TaxID=1310417 RepID=UPI0025B3528C|nr:amino acid permease [Ferruginibacter paludis]MDN3656013.1 amino acid permease [Ferruginibacter paludis]